MATNSDAQAEKPAQSHGIPYCFDPNCPYCKELRAMQESIRSHDFSKQKGSRGA